MNRAPIPHSIDFHAAEIAPSRYYVNVNPGDSISYAFVARVPGAFLYHCGTAPVAAHIANGMYGALIVDPPTGRVTAKEFVLIQSAGPRATKTDKLARRNACKMLAESSARLPLISRQESAVD